MHKAQEVVSLKALRMDRMYRLMVSQELIALPWLTKVVLQAEKTKTMASGSVIILPNR